MFLTYLGHSAIYFGNDDYQVIIDPFISGNPQSSVRITELKVTHVLVTHGHEDHFGDAIELCLQNNARLVANYEICQYASERGVEKVVPLNIGGSAQFPFGEVKMVAAVHSSTITDENGMLIPAGVASGFVIDFFHRSLYHAGDTALTMDMKLLKNKERRFDIAFLPVGGVYTMDVDDAIKATKWLKPKVLIPIHYDTFPEIQTSLKVLEKSFAKGKTLCKILPPGAMISGEHPTTE